MPDLTYHSFQRQRVFFVPVFNFPIKLLNEELFLAAIGLEIFALGVEEPDVGGAERREPLSQKKNND
jgi:hypothetical protein